MVMIGTINLNLMKKKSIWVVVIIQSNLVYIRIKLNFMIGVEEEWSIIIKILTGYEITFKEVKIWKLEEVFVGWCDI